MLLTAAVVAVIYYNYFVSERMRLIDEQIEVIASSLLASDLGDSELEEMTDIVADAIGSEGATTLVSIYNSQGGLLYRNENALNVFNEDDIPLHPQRVLVRTKKHRARLLNLKIAPDGKLLQVGVLLDKGQVHWMSLHFSAFKYLAILFIVLILASFTLSRLLMRPIVSLADYLRFVSNNLGLNNIELKLPDDLERKVAGSARHDEFVVLLSTVRELTRKLQDRFKINQVTGSQMAHELKTPLTILRNCIESLQMAPEVERAPGRAAQLREALGEIEHLTRVINSFLEWSRLEYGVHGYQDIFAIPMGEMLREIVDKLNRIHAQRIHLDIKSEVTLFANRDLLRQLIQNLLLNALRYSPADRPIYCELSRGDFSVRDQGGGLPSAVLQKLGQPFNVGANRKTFNDEESDRGSGLGLAWVSTICKLYDWRLSFESTETGTRVRILF